MIRIPSPFFYSWNTKYYHTDHNLKQAYRKQVPRQVPSRFGSENILPPRCPPCHSVAQHSVQLTDNWLCNSQQLTVYWHQLQTICPQKRTGQFQRDSVVGVCGMQHQCWTQPAFVFVQLFASRDQCIGGGRVMIARSKGSKWKSTLRRLRLGLIAGVPRPEAAVHANFMHTC